MNSYAESGSQPTAQASTRQLLAIGLWLALFVLSALIFVMGIAVWFTGMQQVCFDAPLACYQRLRLTRADVQALESLGWSLRGYAWYALVTRSVQKLLGVAVGLLIFWRKPNDRMAWVASVFLIVGLETSVADALVTAHPIWWLPTRMLSWAGSVCFALFFYLFPNGHFVPHWTKWMAGANGAVSFFIAFFQGSIFDLNQYAVAGGVFIACFFGSFIVAQVYRYRYVSNQVERLQTRWIVFTITLTLAAFLATVSIAVAAGPAAQRINPFFILVDIGFSASAYLLPIAIGVSILRYRLFDIDVIIRRTLVYGTLTALLALIYVGSVVVFQQLTVPLIGRDSPLAIVASTLALAALFQPLRRRIQDLIDRHFYRRKYDAQQTVHAFSQRLRDETNLDALSDDLLHVVQETLQPAHISLWLCEAHVRASEQPSEAR